MLELKDTVIGLPEHVLYYLLESIVVRLFGVFHVVLASVNVQANIGHHFTLH